MPAPVLRLQTASLYASNDASWFTGSGGPWGWSPFTGQFGGVVSSAGLAAQPFDDVLNDVSPGDEVSFVIAVQTLGGAAYGVRLRNAMPAGFVLPASGADVSVANGAGTALAWSGDLFGTGGLTIGAPLAAYDADTGRNVALVTFTLQAGASLPGPYARVQGTAELLAAAASPGGPNVADPASAQTIVVSSAPAAVVVPDTDPSAVGVDQVIGFTATVTLPVGTLGSLTLVPMVPAGLRVVGAKLLGVGGGLSVAGTPVVGADGVVSFGTIRRAVAAGDATVTVHFDIRAGMQGGEASLRVAVGGKDQAGGYWSTAVSTVLNVVAPPAPPLLGGIQAAQRGTTSMVLHPFGGLELASVAPGAGTLAVSLIDPAAGRLAAVAGGSVEAGGALFVASGTLAELQAAARSMSFSPAPGRTGAAQLAVTLIDGAGGTVQDRSTFIDVQASVDPGQAQHFDPDPGSSFLTATADGQRTVAMGELYGGPVDYLKGQFIYDGSDPVVIVAQSPNVFVKSFVGNAAVALQAGRNVVDAGKGSNFLVGGTGDDVFFLDGRSKQETWNTIVGFNQGDMATLFGFVPGVSRMWWEDRAGAAGFEGRTLRADLGGTGALNASLTFAGLAPADTDRFTITTGRVGDADYMLLQA